MAQDVTYTDLQFVKTPPERSQEKGTWNQVEQLRMPPSMTHPLAPLPDPGEGELTYENVQGPPCQEERTPTATEGTEESDRRTWYAILALLAACLFLLTAAIGLGVRYWQVSRQLQQATEDGSALERRMGSQEGSLAQTQAQLEEAQEELHSTNRTLWNCLAAGNRTQEQLRQANQSLTLTQKEKEKLQQQLDQTMKSLEEAKSCQKIGCCPHGWNLFRWKCLWISSSWEKKSWEESQEACKRKSSQLLVLKPWSAKELWDATFIDKSDQYWIGLKTSWGSLKSSWKWIDGRGFEE
ncbi:B-cell differentiation antigen CD72-like [Podarcis raffonei]|uniref:B-cell differentiation antigen CD72-like n=1 Tax=Podarcis raffonei TaxID=65483 RepID=UPI00232956E3|nr:B-cell differentiation antigen CD72-like [Podarcis raffonei]